MEHEEDDDDEGQSFDEDGDPIDNAKGALDVPKAGRGDGSLGCGLRCDDSHPDCSYLSILLGDLPERAWCIKAVDCAIVDAIWTAGLANRG